MLYNLCNVLFIISHYFRNTKMKQLTFHFISICVLASVLTETQLNQQDKEQVSL